MYNALSVIGYFGISPMIFEGEIFDKLMLPIHTNHWLSLAILAYLLFLHGLLFYLKHSLQQLILNVKWSLKISFISYPVSL